MKSSNDTIGNRTRDLPTCSAVPQPTAPPAACPLSLKGHGFLFIYLSIYLCIYVFIYVLIYLGF